MSNQNDSYCHRSPSMPDGAQRLINGSFYKIGVHGKIFRFVNGGWILSIISMNEFRCSGFPVLDESPRSMFL